MSNWKEINDAYKILKNNKITIMQCTSTYPCRPEDAGINILNELKKRYRCSLGFSDHTQGCEAAIMAINNGASVIEKHLTFSKKCAEVMQSLQWRSRNLKILQITKKS